MVIEIVALAALFFIGFALWGIVGAIRIASQNIAGAIWHPEWRDPPTDWSKRR